MSAWDNDRPTNSPHGDGQYNPDLNARVGGWRSVIPMRPLSVGETLDGALRLIRFNPVPFIVFPAIVNLVVAAINMLVGLAFGESAFTTTASYDTSVVFSVLTMIVSLVGNLIVLAAGTRVTLATIRGRKLSLGETLQMARRQLGVLAARMLGLMALVLLAVFLFFTVIFAVLFGIFDSLDVGSTGFVFNLIAAPVFFMAIGFVMFYRFSITAPAMVAEEIGPIVGLRRSWELTKGSFGYFAGLLLTAIAIGAALTFLFTLFFAFTVGLSVYADNNAGFFLTTGVVGIILVSLLAALIIAPIVTAVTNLVYVNMRMKRENFHQDALFQAGRQEQINGKNGQQPYGYNQYGQSQHDQTFGGDPSGEQAYGSAAYGPSSQNGYGQWAPPTAPGSYNSGTNQSGVLHPNDWQERPEWYHTDAGSRAASSQAPRPDASDSPDTPGTPTGQADPDDPFKPKSPLS